MGSVGDYVASVETKTMPGINFRITKIVGHEPNVWGSDGPNQDPPHDPFESPAEDILPFEGQLAGNPVCLIANGPSVNELDLGRITCATVGLNRAWKLGRWDYYCIGDMGQFREYERYHGHVEANGKLTRHPRDWCKELSPLFAEPNGPQHAIRIRVLHTKTRAISFDLTEGVYLNNTITAFGIQLAFWLQADPIYIVGLDLWNTNGMGHFWGGKSVDDWKFSNQRECFGYIAGYLDAYEEFHTYEDPPKIINLNPGSSCWAFEKRRFEEVFP